MPRKKKPERREYGAWSIDLHTASGRYRVRPPASVDPKRRPRYFATRDEARAWATAERARITALTTEQRTELTVGDWLGRWYTVTADAADWTVRSRAVYRTHLWYWSRIHHIRLRDLKTADLNLVVGQLRTVGPERRPEVAGVRTSRQAPRPLSAKVIRDAAATLTRALSAARDDGWMERNPASSMALPKVVEQKVDLWTLKERRLLIAELETDPLYPVFVLLLTCGLRIGEALALQWPDVDHEEKRLTIRRTVHKTHVQEWPKNRKPRQVTLSRYAQAALILHRDRGTLTGPLWVFTREDGRPVGYERVRKRLIAACTRAGVTYRPTHVARHTHVTELMAAGVMPADIAERVGHTGLGTLPRYAHATEAGAARILEVADAIVGNAFRDEQGQSRGYGDDSDGSDQE